jgi:hypothetical protein
MQKRKRIMIYFQRILKERIIQYGSGKISSLDVFLDVLERMHRHLGMARRLPQAPNHVF